MLPHNQPIGPHHPQVKTPPIPVKPVNYDAKFMRHIPALINIIADGNPDTAKEWKIIVRLRRSNGESWESVYQLLSQAAFPSI